MDRIRLEDLNNHLSEIDSFISAASFEDRCLSVIKSFNFSYVKNKIICFNKDQQDIINYNLLMIKDVLPDLESIYFDTSNPLVTANSLSIFFNSLNDFALGNLLVDISTFTHEGLMILIKFLSLYKKKYTSIKLIYVTASDYSYNEQDVKKKWLSKGIKNVRSILGYPGIMNPNFPNHLVVLFGFELDRTRKLVDRLGFENISFGFGASKDSIGDDHFKINRERHKDLLLNYPHAYEFEFSLTDPVEAKNNIISHLKRNKFEKFNIVIAPMNTKLSTIGSALVAFDFPQIQICYALPSDYNIKYYSIPGNDCFIGNLEFFI